MAEQLKLTFHPPFHPSLDFTLKMEKDTGVMIYRVYDPQNPLMKEPFTAGFDTLTCVVGGKAYAKFVETIRSVNFKDHKNPPRTGIILDETKVEVQYISTAFHTGKLDFKLYDRALFKMEFQLLDGFFEFAENVLEETKRLEFIRDLKQSSVMRFSEK